MFWHADVRKVDGESAAPNAQPIDVEHGEITGQGEHERLRVVATQRFQFAVLIRHLDAVLARLRARSHPEEGIWPSYR